MAEQKPKVEMETIQQYAYFLCSYQLTIVKDEHAGFSPIEVVTRLDDFKFTQERLCKLRNAAISRYVNSMKEAGEEEYEVVNAQLINIIPLGIMTEEEFDGNIKESADC